MKPIAFALAACTLIAAVSAQTDAPAARTTTRLDSWSFLQDEALDSPDKQPAENAASRLPGNASKWTPVTVPHVFRQQGLPDDTAGWYRTTVDADPSSHRYLLHLEGAASVSDIYANGQRVGRHRGAYTSSVHDLTPALRQGSNTIDIRVSNGDHEATNCLSHSTLYVTNGGLYRPVRLIETGSVHLDPYMGSTGLFLTGKSITTENADLEIKAHVRNHLDHDAAVGLSGTVTGPDGAKVADFKTTGTIKAGEAAPLATTVTVADPKLWAVRDPQLYSVTVTVVVDGKPTDTLTEKTGFRTIKMEDGKFMLNGEELLVRGVNKHQQTEHEWNAISDAELDHEWKLMDEMGINTVRLAHYPHRRYEYHHADEIGLAVWAENGLAGQLWQGQVKRDSGEREPNADGERVTREMVFQNWNHPSIIFWSSGNETYEKVAARYADVIRENDTTRLVTYASAHEDRPDTVDFIAGNTYQGWYGGHFTGFSDLPQNKYVSETGAGTWITHHIPQGEARWQVDHFEPMEYGNYFTEYRLQSVFGANKEKHKMYLWWNFREFYDRKFKNNRNTKGMIMLSGTPKDVYYLHRAFLRPDLPILRITSRNHFYRWFPADNGTKVFSNAEWVELFINGESQGKRNNGDYRQPRSVYPKEWQGDTMAINNVFFWNAPLQPGRNVVEAKDSNGQTDTVVVYQRTATGDDAENDLVSAVESSNSDNVAHYIGRPVEAQSPFYYMVDGSSDNTFDKLPEALEGATWISTKRLSDPKAKTDLSFTLKKEATVFVMHSTGTFPAIVLREPDQKLVAAAEALEKDLKFSGFTKSDEAAIWRGHDMWLADAAVWGRKAKAGQTIKIPGQTLDYVVLIKE